MLKLYRLFFIALIISFCQTETSRAQSISPLGLGMGVEGTVNTMEYDSVDHLLYVGGQFSYIDGVACNSIAVWDGESWSALGKGINGYVYAIKKVGDDVYVGGGFDSAGDVAARCIAMWDGTSWHPLGSGVGTDYLVNTIESYRGDIYIGGEFTKVDTVEANQLAVWKLDHWESIGTSSEVEKLININDTLWAAGYFQKIDTVFAHNFAFFDGVKWNSAGFVGNYGYQSQAIDFNGNLYTIFADTIEHYSGNKWVFDFSQANINFLAGFNHSLYTLTANYFLGTDSLRKLDHGSLDSAIKIFSLENNFYINEYLNVLAGTGSFLLLGGQFGLLNNQAYTSLAMFNGVSWSAPGRVGLKGADDFSGYNSIRCIQYDTVLNAYLYYGAFSFLNGKYAPGIGIANKSDSSWSTLGTGFNDIVRKIVRYKGQLYAAGSFTKSGSTTVNHIARWSGTEWESLGTGTNDIVYDLAVYNGYLYAGGAFTSVNGAKINYVAKYDGSKWYNANMKAIKKAVYCFGVFNNTLYCGTLINDVGTTDQNSGIFDETGNDLWLIIGSEDGQDFLAEGDTLYLIENSESAFGVKSYYFNEWHDLEFPSTGNSAKGRLLYMNHTLYCTTDNDGFWEYKNNSWNHIGYTLCYAALRVNDSEYYIGGDIPSDYLNVSTYVELNDLAVLKFAPPHINFAADTVFICDHRSIFYQPHSSELNPKYQWHFTGGFPDTSSQIAPIIKYDVPGTYPVWCVVSNDVGKDTLRLADSVTVENCADTGTQKYDYTWILGYHYYYNGPLPALDFYHNKPDSTGFYSPFDFFRDDACISDSDGNLMFFTDGYDIADASGSTIPGSSLFNQEGGGIEFQPVIILPSLSQPDQYYLIHNNGTSFRGHNGQYYNQPLSLDYSVVNMNEKTRKGIMTEVNQHIFNDTLMYGTMNAVKYANGKDWWLEIHEWNSNVFCLVRYTAQGFTQVIRDTAGPIYGNGAYISQALFSPDGSQFALVHEDSNKVDLYNFDRCKGEFQFRQTIYFNDSVDYVTSCSFSPNSQYLYVSGLLTLFQFDTQVPDVASSEEIIGKYDGFGDPIQTYFFGHQLAPDGKIYIGTYDGCDHLHVINNPNEKGIACNFVQHQVHLDGYSDGPLPLFPNYRLGKLEGSICDSIATAIFNPVLPMMNLYPNPASSSLNIAFSKPIQSSATLRVYDETGQLLLSENLGSYIPSLIRINTDKLRPGIYILNITDRDKSYSRSFVKD